MSNKSESNSKQTSLYHLTVNRKTSGLEGDYETMGDAIERLKIYTESFPDEVIEATITKIK